MEVRFNSTRPFEKSLRALPGKERDKIVAKINHLADLYSEGISSFSRFATPLKYKVFGGYDSSLFTARLSHKDRLIFTAEDDPIQDEVVITLFALTTPDKYSRVLEGITESLYQERLHADDAEVVVNDTI
jgi:hypothetical protein